MGINYFFPVKYKIQTKSKTDQKTPFSGEILQSPGSPKKKPPCYRYSLKLLDINNSPFSREETINRDQPSDDPDVKTSYEVAIITDRTSKVVIILITMLKNVKESYAQGKYTYNE